MPQAYRQRPACRRLIIIRHTETDAVPARTSAVCDMHARARKENRTRVAAFFSFDADVADAGARRSPFARRLRAAMLRSITTRSM